MKTDQVALYLEDIWTKGFKLSDEEVRFIYFGRKFTNANYIQVKLAIQLTLAVQYTFDRSFYISLLELFHSNNIIYKKNALELMKKKGII
ncbi:DUF6123 family protein [Saliterribacillus persicus]|uniref:Uncharacterized protein n=1 Tax=Saliterribacillus persicus TaxID=930114 RepID=A0A368XEQ7_9BACI|nr:DUF6123 family protein [Saliterribacillus persicus]RCW64957.1 hypothetical protein DFR57_112136 [Saliterribacillus persicus]